jgi:DNA-binding NarL/FixJ family response regulator
LLEKHFPGTPRARVPAILRDPAQTPAGLRVSASSPVSALDCVLFLLEEMAPAPTPAALASLGLTPRETEILFWLANGKTNADIGSIVGVAPATVKKHVENLLPKLGVETRLAAALKAMELIGSTIST